MRSLATLRPPFLLLVPACLSLSWAWALHTGSTVQPLDLALLMLGALAAHGAVNSLNELQDFRSGLDFHTRRTPFSGGSGTLPRTPALEAATRALVLGCLLVTVAVGLYFLWQRGLALLPIGLAGLALIVFYTSTLTRRPLLCLFAPGLGFGLLMVNGGYLALTGQSDPLLAWLSLLPTCLVSNLLLINQFPDIEADRAAGRRHLLVVRGPAAGVKVFALLQGLAWLPLLLALQHGSVPATASLALLALPAAIAAAVGLARHRADAERLVPFMGLHVATTLAAPVLLAIGLQPG